MGRSRIGGRLTGDGPSAGRKGSTLTVAPYLYLSGPLLKNRHSMKCTFANSWLSPGKVLVLQCLQSVLN